MDEPKKHDAACMSVAGGPGDDYCICAKPQFKTVKICMDGPGSSGDLEIEVSPQEREFLERLAKAWNEHNSLHAQPYFTLSSTKEGKT